jgi:hemoglobin
LQITEEQRQRFVELYMAALDASRMPTDEPFRAAVHEHVEFGSRVALQNSYAATDAELNPLREVPHWTWAGDD